MATYRQLSVIVKDREGRYWMLSGAPSKPLLQEAKAPYFTLKCSFGSGGTNPHSARNSHEMSEKPNNALPLRRSQERSGLVS